MSENLKENYSLMFTTYPDIVDITQMRKMLGGIGVTLAYKLLKQGKIKSLKISREYRISKSCIIVLSYKDNMNKRKQKWISTGISVKGNNKRLANKKLEEIKQNYEKYISLTVTKHETKTESLLFVWLG